MDGVGSRGAKSAEIREDLRLRADSGPVLWERPHSTIPKAMMVVIWFMDGLLDMLHSHCPSRGEGLRAPTDWRFSHGMDFQISPDFFWRRGDRDHPAVDVVRCPR